MIDESFVRAIAQMADENTTPVAMEVGTTPMLVTRDGDEHKLTIEEELKLRAYEATKKMAEVPGTYAVETLEAFKALLPTIVEIEGINPREVAVHVTSPTAVVAYLMKPDALQRRRKLATCDCSAVTPGVTFAGKWMTSEDMNILLQTQFSDLGLTDPNDDPEDAPDDGRTDRERLMELVGTLVEQQVVITKDDGVSQGVEVRTEMMIKKEVAPRLVWLNPYRTFRDLVQPGSPFLLRVRAGEDKPGRPTLALFETDGGVWRLTAMKAVAENLRVTCLTQGYHLLV